MKIKVYSRAHCQMCHAVTNELLERGIGFKVLPADKHLKKIAEQLAAQGNALPVIETDSCFVTPQDIIAGRICTDGSCEVGK